MRPGGSTRPMIEKPVTRLAGAGLADQAEDLAAAHRVKVDAVRRAFTTPARRKTRVFRPRRRPRARIASHALRPCEPRVQHVAQVVADQVDGDDRRRAARCPDRRRSSIRRRACSRSRWRSAGRARARSPARRRPGRTASPPARSRARPARSRPRSAAAGVGQQVAEDDARLRQGAGSARPRCIRAPRLDQRRAAHGARVIGPLHQHQRDHHLVDALAQDGQQHQRDQDRRKRQLDVDDASAARRRGRRNRPRSGPPPCRSRGDQPPGPTAHHQAGAQAVQDGREGGVARSSAAVDCQRVGDRAVHVARRCPGGNGTQNRRCPASRCRRSSAAR